MKDLVLDRAKKDSNLFFVIEDGTQDQEEIELYAIIEVQKENKSPYVYWTFFKDKPSLEVRMKLEREAISTYFEGRRMWG